MHNKFGHADWLPFIPCS